MGKIYRGICSILVQNWFWLAHMNVITETNKQKDQKKKKRNMSEWGKLIIWSFVQKLTVYNTVIVAGSLGITWETFCHRRASIGMCWGGKVTSSKRQRTSETASGNDMTQISKNCYTIVEIWSWRNLISILSPTVIILFATEGNNFLRSKQNKMSCI